MLKNWCNWSVALEKTLENPLDCKEIKPVNPKGNWLWIFIGRTDAKAKTPTLWQPNAKNWLTWKDPNVGKDWRQEEEGTTEDEIVWWHHWLDGHEFEQALGVGDGQGSLECCSPWGRKESDITEWPKWTELKYLIYPKWQHNHYILGRWKSGYQVCTWYCEGGGKEKKSRIFIFQTGNSINNAQGWNIR